MRTEHFKIFLLAVAVILTMAGCGGSDKKDNSPVNPVTEGQTFQQSVTLDAQGTQQTVMLTSLKSKIDDVKNTTTWLTVLIGTYTSGSPNIVLSAEENTNTQTRNGNVTITSISGDKVILTVTQQKAEEQKAGIDDSHDIPTDKPAYSRRR